MADLPLRVEVVSSCLRVLMHIFVMSISQTTCDPAPLPCCGVNNETALHLPQTMLFNNASCLLWSQPHLAPHMVHICIWHMQLQSVADKHIWLLTLCPGFIMQECASSIQAPLERGTRVFADESYLITQVRRLLASLNCIARLFCICAEQTRPIFKGHPKALIAHSPASKCFEYVARY